MKANNVLTRPLGRSRRRVSHSEFLTNHSGDMLVSTRSERPADPRVTVVIPAKNEARNLEVVLPELPDVYEVILVDGRSEDDTVATARRLMPTIRVLTQTRRGKGNALACGFAAATGDVIVMFDADGSADASEIGAFVDALRSGADFAKGSRFAPGGGSHDITRFRSAGNRVLNVIANLMMRTRYTDLCYGYNAFWSDIRQEFELPEHAFGSVGTQKMIWGDGFEIETVINCRIASAGLTVREVGSVERLRVHGESNLNAVSDGFRVLKTIVTERRRHRARLAAPPVPVPRPAAAVHGPAAQLDVGRDELSESA